MERLLRTLYGSTPQIDLDRQFARVRVPNPQPIDPAALVDGLKRNNVGYGGLTIQADVEVGDGRVVLSATGQSFALEGAAPESGLRSSRVLRVRDAATPVKTRVELVR